MATTTRQGITPRAAPAALLTGEEAKDLIELVDAMADSHGGINAAWRDTRYLRRLAGIRAKLRRLY